MEAKWLLPFYIPLLQMVTLERSMRPGLWPRDTISMCDPLCTLDKCGPLVRRSRDVAGRVDGTPREVGALIEGRHLYATHELHMHSRALGLCWPLLPSSPLHLSIL